MRLLKLIALLFLTFSPIFAKAQLIEWSEDRPLTWQDFKGRPDYKTGWGGVTFRNILYSYNCEFRDSVYKITFNIKSVFDTQKSWVKRAQMANDYALSHEQGHFDINELFARKMAAAFHSTVYSSNYKEEIKAIFDKYWAALNAMEAKYDAETEHSNNATMQYQWQLYISLMLKNLPRNY